MTDAKKPDGGQAFPVPGGPISQNGDPLNFAEPGMTLRDYFATHAPHDRVEFENLDQMLEFLGTHNVSPGGLVGKAIDAAKVQAKLAYIWADAMIAERSK